jgi:hypothetical protein
MGGALSIHTLGSSGSVGLFGVYGTERLRQRARELAEGIETDEDQIFHSLVFASASDESNSDAIVTRRPYLLRDEGHERRPP